MAAEIDAGPFTPDQLDEVIAFVRKANPFAQRLCGWDLGRFLDWRWGGSGSLPDTWFAENCTIHRDANGIRAIWLREDDRDPTSYLLTSDEDPAAVDAAIRSLDGPIRLGALEDAAWFGEALSRLGFGSEPGDGQEWEYDPARVSVPALPDGHRFASAADGLDPRSVSECIVRAFGRSGELVGLLERLATNPFHDPGLSMAVTTTDGAVVAYCQGTVDPVSGVGGIDPVVTHPDHQRKGLGKAVVSECLSRQADRGARMVFIGSAAEPAPETNLYRSLGPVAASRTIVWSRPFVRSA